jgi:hypothetical protein
MWNSMARSSIKTKVTGKDGRTNSGMILLLYDLFDIF